jgi:hypothetical protein
MKPHEAVKRVKSYRDMRKKMVPTPCVMLCDPEAPSFVVRRLKFFFFLLVLVGRGRVL